MATRVPSAGAETMEQWPPRRSARSRIELSPNVRAPLVGQVDDAGAVVLDAAVGARGAPRSSRTRISPERPCRAAFCSASQVARPSSCAVRGVTSTRSRSRRTRHPKRGFDVAAHFRDDAIECDDAIRRIQWLVPVVTDLKTRLGERALGGRVHACESLAVVGFTLRERGLHREVRELLRESVVQLGREGASLLRAGVARDAVPRAWTSRAAARRG